MDTLYIFASRLQQLAVGAQQAAFNQPAVQVMALHQTGKTVAAEVRLSFSTDQQVCNRKLKMEGFLTATALFR